MFKNTVVRVFSRTENDVLRATLLAFYALLWGIMLVLVALGCLYIYFEYFSEKSIDELFSSSSNELSPESKSYLYNIIQATIVSPILETYICFKIPLNIASHFKLNRTFSVHANGFIFGLIHVLVFADSPIRLVTYFCGVVMGWSWYLHEELPDEQKTMRRFWFVALLHAIYNALLILLIALTYLLPS